MIRTIIVDDEPSAVNVLALLLKKRCKDDVEVIATSTSPLEGKKLIEQHQPDLVFLDIEMPVMNGFVMLQQLSYKDFELIFVTAYDHYAIKAIRFSALDYLVKPVEIEELKNAVNRVAVNHSRKDRGLQLELLLDYLDKKRPRRITIPTSDGLQFIDIENIVYLEASNNYTNVYLADQQKYLVTRTLKDFEQILPAETFLRIHHSTIINRDFIEKYIRGEGGQVMMSNGIVLDVSKRKKIEFLEAIGNK